ncbi:MAG: hypothetical protein HQL06_10200 [Nitrospirae bacterium]|nr:hypothetical protein [Nitrospirota bacterium]
MTNLEKLQAMLLHWKHHNVEHASTYQGWADKMSEEGHAELSVIMKTIAFESVKINELFDKALILLENKV